MAQTVKNPPAMQETWVQSLGWEDPLEKGTVLLGFPGCSDSKESTCNVGDLGLIPGLGRSPGEEYSKPLQYSCLENPHGQRSLAGYSPWGCKESDTTEQLSTQHKCSITTSYYHMPGTALSTLQPSPLTVACSITMMW